LICLFYFIGVGFLFSPFLKTKLPFNQSEKEKKKWFIE